VLGKLGGDELEVAFYEHEVGSRLIGLPQRQDVIFVMPEDGCVNHAVRWLSYSRNSRLVRRRNRAFEPSESLVYEPSTQGRPLTETQVRSRKGNDDGLRES